MVYYQLHYSSCLKDVCTQFPGLTLKSIANNLAFYFHIKQTASYFGRYFEKQFSSLIWKLHHCQVMIHRRLFSPSKRGKYFRERQSFYTQWIQKNTAAGSTNSQISVQLSMSEMCKLIFLSQENFFSFNQTWGISLDVEAKSNPTYLQWRCCRGVFL